MSFLSLRLETSLIFSFSYPLATIFLILLDDTFTMCLLPFLLFILHLHISSFLNFCSIFLIQPTFNSIRHINIRVIFGKLQIWIQIFAHKPYIAHLCLERKKNTIHCLSFKAPFNHLWSTLQLHLPWIFPLKCPHFSWVGLMGILREYSLLSV